MSRTHLSLRIRFHIVRNPKLVLLCSSKQSFKELKFYFTIVVPNLGTGARHKNGGRESLKPRITNVKKETATSVSLKIQKILVVAFLVRDVLRDVTK